MEFEFHYAVSVPLKGCPALFLLKLLFHHRVFETSVDSQRCALSYFAKFLRVPTILPVPTFEMNSLLYRFFLLYEKLIGCGSQNLCDFLAFCQSAMKTLQSAITRHDSAESLYRLWNVIASKLSQHIVKVPYKPISSQIKYLMNTMLKTCIINKIIHTISDKKWLDITLKFLIHCFNVRLYDSYQMFTFEVI